MTLIISLVNFIIHIDAHLLTFTSQYGSLTYLLVFMIIFAETGLVITPFLPGDSLLFALGALSALGSLNLTTVLIILSLAAVLGDTVNYWIGHFFGEKLLTSRFNRLIKKEHIHKTQAFYAKHGGKTIVLARFVPIVRTFAPFVAGVGRMNYSQFLTYNLLGGVLWVFSFTLLGFFFGNIPTVKDNFTLVVLAIIALSVLPIIIEAVKHRLTVKE